MTYSSTIVKLIFLSKFVIRNALYTNENIVQISTGYIKAKYSIYNLRKFRTLSILPIHSKTVSSEKECVRLCNDVPNCYGFTLPSDLTGIALTCELYDKNLETGFGGYSYANNFYELQSECTKNPDICEHGSICVPEFLNKTYHCKYCYYPFTGKNCNEIIEGATVEAGPYHEDILKGRNKSCHAIKKHFGQSLSGAYRIYPWRDWRYLKVFCTKGFMRIYGMETQPETLNRFTDVVHQSDLTGLDFQVTTSFLYKFYTLTQFRHFFYVCQRGNNLPKTYKTYPPSHEVSRKERVFLEYMIGAGNTTIESCYNQENNIDFRCNDVINGQVSGNKGTERDNRNFQNILIFNDGAMFGVVGSMFGCFDSPSFRPALRAHMENETRSTTALQKNANTCKMGPDENQLFRANKVQPIVQSILDNTFKNYNYNSSNAGQSCKDLVEDIKRRAKTLCYFRYKFVCEVTLVTNNEQTTKIASRYLLDNKTDDYFTCTYEGKNYTVVLSFVAVYYE